MNLPPTRSPSYPPTNRPPPRISTSVHPAALPRSSVRAVPRLRANLARLLQRLRNLNVTDFESADKPPLRLEALALSVATDVRAILDDATAHYAMNPTTTGLSAQHILDLASIARMELSGLTAIINRESESSVWQRVAVCDSVLQVARRCLRALDTVIANVEGLSPPVDDTADETALAVQIRQAYVEMNRVVVGDDLPDSETIRPRLRAAGNCIARTLGRSIAPAIRVHDRYTMRAFQQRIRDALLSAGHDDAAIDELLRIWQDLSNFTALLLDVNKREELRVHDRDTIATVLEAIDGLTPAAPVPEAHLATLRACEGRDPELDALLAGGSSVGTLRQCLERLHHALTATIAPPASTTSGTWSGLL